MSMNVYIQISHQDWQPGLVLAKRAGLENLLDEFAAFMAKVYRDELVRAINQQRYKWRWQPLSDNYLQYKKRAGLSTNIWEATGILKKSITYWKVGSRYVVGVNPRAVYPKTGVTVLSVMRRMEYGTDKMPARPLFVPLAVYINKHIKVYWRRFLNSKGLVS